MQTRCWWHYSYRIDLIIITNIYIALFLIVSLYIYVAIITDVHSPLHTGYCYDNITSVNCLRCTKKQYWDNISSIFYRNSEVNASELIEITAYMCSQYYIHSNQPYILHPLSKGKGHVVYLFNQWIFNWFFFTYI